MIRTLKSHCIKGYNKNSTLGSQRKTVPQEMKINLKSKNKKKLSVGKGQESSFQAENN